MNAKALHNLSGFSGTENYYRHMGGLLLTDGVKFLADNADCYWLLDIIASYQREKVIQKDPMMRQMQFWHLRPVPESGMPEILTEGGVKVHEKCREGQPEAYVTCERDQNDVAIVQEIPMTNFPFHALEDREITLYVEIANGRAVCLLPSEH